MVVQIVASGNRGGLKRGQKEVLLDDWETTTPTYYASQYERREL